MYNKVKTASCNMYDTAIYRRDIHDHDKKRDKVIGPYIHRRWIISATII